MLRRYHKHLSCTQPWVWDVFHAPCQQESSSPSPCLLCFGLMILSLDPSHSLHSKQDLKVGLGMFSGLAPAEGGRLTWMRSGASLVMLPSSTAKVKHPQEESTEIPLRVSVWL